MRPQYSRACVHWVLLVADRMYVFLVEGISEYSRTPVSVGSVCIGSLVATDRMYGRQAYVSDYSRAPLFAGVKCIGS